MFMKLWVFVPLTSFLSPQTVFASKMSDDYWNMVRDCDFNYAPLTDTRTEAEVIHYDNNKAYADFVGVDYTPENSHITKWSLLNAKIRHYPKYTQKAPYGINIGTCSKDLDDGSTWVFEKVGPFKSTGGYDWWQFEYGDVYGMKEIFKTHKDGVYMVNNINLCVDKDFKPLEFPPIHLHHIHITVGEWNYFKNVARAECYKESNTCGMIGNVIYETHGDWQCPKEKGGLDCLFGETHAPYAYLVDFPLSVNAEVNDVRLDGSPELEYYYFSAVKYYPKTPETSLRFHTPLSKFYGINPGMFKLFSNQQSDMIGTQLIPTDRYTLSWYTGYLPKGRLIDTKFHIHSNIVQFGYIFRTDPKTLGIDKWIPDTTIDLIDIESLGFLKSTDVVQYMYSNIRKTGLTVEDATVCNITSNVEHVDTAQGKFPFDRQASLDCITQVEFDGTEQFTVITFYDTLDKPTSPHAPDTVPEHYPSHFQFFWIFDNHKGTSEFPFYFHTQELGNIIDWTTPSKSLLTTSILWYGFPQTRWKNRMFNSIVLGFILCWVGMCAFGMVSCAGKCSRWRKLNARKKTDEEIPLSKTKSGDVYLIGFL